ncbi:MAG TPA: type IV secretion system protein, partial [Brevundimonas sp.]|nr:type IV secretion system protein [Brevundimonas sp.]
MRARILSAAAVAALVVAGAPAARAQQIVHDPRALAQMIEEARTTLDQLKALQTQVEQGQRLFDSLNNLSDVNALAGELGLPTVRNPLPDMRSMRAAANGDLGALGDLADRANAIRRDSRLYTP